MRMNALCTTPSHVKIFRRMAAHCRMVAEATASPAEREQMELVSVQFKVEADEMAIAEMREALLWPLNG
jgi:hypothetical protein